MQRKHTYYTKLVKNPLLASSKTSLVFATLQWEGGERPHERKTWGHANYKNRYNLKAFFLTMTASFLQEQGL